MDFEFCEKLFLHQLIWSSKVFLLWTVHYNDYIFKYWSRFDLRGAINPLVHVYIFIYIAWFDLVIFYGIFVFMRDIGLVFTAFGFGIRVMLTLSNELESVPSTSWKRLYKYNWYYCILKKMFSEILQWNHLNLGILFWRFFILWIQFP